VKLSLLVIVAVMLLWIPIAEARWYHDEGTIDIQCHDDKKVELKVVVFHTSGSRDTIISLVHDELQKVVDELEISSGEIKNQIDEVERRTADRVNSVDCVYIQKIIEPKKDDEGMSLAGAFIITLLISTLFCLIIFQIGSFYKGKLERKKLIKKINKGEKDIDDPDISLRTESKILNEIIISKFPGKGRCPECGKLWHIKVDYCMTCNHGKKEYYERRGFDNLIPTTDVDDIEEDIYEDLDYDNEDDEEDYY
jgi:hypothetical protein